MKISWLAFLTYFVVAQSSLLATKQSPSQEELKFQNHMKERALGYQQSFVPMTFLPELCSCEAAAGLGMGTLNVGLGTLGIAPEAVLCSHAAGSTSCVLSGIIGGIIAGGLCVASLCLSGILVNCRYIKVRDYNIKNIQPHIELAKLIETAFNYDDHGPIKHTPKNEKEVLIVDSDNDVIHEMINNYHKTDPTYKISAAELARRIRQAIFAGYLTPINLVNIPEEGKWANFSVYALTTQLMIKLDGLKTYYEAAKKNYDTLYERWKEIRSAQTQISSCVVDLDKL